METRRTQNAVGRLVVALAGVAGAFYVALQSLSVEWLVVGVLAFLAGALRLPFWSKTEQVPVTRLLQPGSPPVNDAKRLRAMLAHQRMLGIVRVRWRIRIEAWAALVERARQVPSQAVEPIAEAVELIVNTLIRRSAVESSALLHGLWAGASPFSFCLPGGYEALVGKVLDHVSPTTVAMLGEDGVWLQVVRGRDDSDGSRRVMDWLVRSANPPVRDPGSEQGMLVLTPQKLGEGSERHLASHRVGKPEFVRGLNDELWILRYTAGFQR